MKEVGFMFSFLWNEMAQPKAFGWFHLMFFVIIGLVTFLLVEHFRNCNEKTFRLIIFFSWLITILLETGKQIIFNYDIHTGSWLPYNFSSFPFQFCSLTIYILPLLVFLKDSKLRDLLLVFTATYVFVGGFGYFFFPVSFCNYVFINFQTMIHHGIQIYLGIFIFAHEYKKMNVKSVLKGAYILIGNILISMILNVWFYNISSDPSSVNLFELSPINPTTAPVFSDVVSATNYYVFLILYIGVFIFYACLIYFGFDFIYKKVAQLEEKRHSKIQTNE